MVSEAYQPRPQHAIGKRDVDAPARQDRGPVTTAPASVIPACVAAAREESRVFAVFSRQAKPQRRLRYTRATRPRCSGILRAPDTRENDKQIRHLSFSVRRLP